MGLIQCSESCRFQKDGYCQLEKCSTVNSYGNICPHFMPKLFDYRNCLTETSYPNEF